MNIRSNPLGKTPGSAADRLHDASRVPQKSDRTRDGETASPGGTDRVELSGEARELERRLLAAAAGSALPQDRLRGILDRLASGFYESPEIVDAVVTRLGGDVGSPDRGDGAR